MRRAGIYARISLDVAGEGLGVQRQEEDCRRKADVMGWKVAELYVDNDKSASKAVVRPEYERMLADLEAGVIDAVVVYDLDRLTRKPAELEDFIDLTDRLGTALANVSGDVDLTTANGRMIARIKGAVARQEADRIGERVKRQKQQRLRDQGLPPASRYRTFGYTRDWQVIEEEAEIVREAFERCANGESVNSISRDFRERGVLTGTGKPMSFAATARILGSPIYAGLLSYKGEVVGKAAESVPKLVTEAMVNTAAQRPSRPAWGTRKHLLSGIAICDLCKTQMNFTQGGYVCARIVGGCGKVRIKGEWLDDAVEHAVHFLVIWKRRQNRPVAPVSPEPVTDPVEDIDRDIEKAQAAHDAGDLDLVDLLPILKSLRSRRAKAVDAQADAIEQDSTWKTMDDYDDADLSLKRTIIRRHVVAVPVSPTTVPGSNKYDPTRFKIVTAYKDEHGKDLILNGEQCDLIGSIYGAREFAKGSPDLIADEADFVDNLIGVIWGMVDKGHQ